MERAFFAKQTQTCKPGYGVTAHCRLSLPRKEGLRSRSERRPSRKKRRHLEEASQLVDASLAHSFASGNGYAPFAGAKGYDERLLPSQVFVSATTVRMNR